MNLVVVFFLYGLAFFSMGLVVGLEAGRAIDSRFARALRPLAAFGILHGTHEWLEMFGIIAGRPINPTGMELQAGLRLGLLAFSFLSLSGFGASMLAPTERAWRLNLLLPLCQALIWAMGSFALPAYFHTASALWDAEHVWTRYSLGVPGALITAWGLIEQQRLFRAQGLERFGRDSLWAAVAFAWYGLVGQVFAQISGLPPSNVINEYLFLTTFGFPVQFVRAASAVVAAIFVVRLLRAFDVETRRRMADLREASMQETRKREALREEYLRQIVRVQENERQRVGRELHDETGQALTALGLGLRGAATSLRTDPDLTARQLRELEALAVRSLDGLRRLIADLRPPHLDDLGLTSAIRWYIGELERRLPLKVALAVEGERRRLAPEVRTALFRVVQEALTNVVKHAATDHASVTVAFLPDRLELLVEDSGRGFDPASSGDGRTAWGLIGMQERASLLGGECQITSAPGEGTHVRLWVPLPPDSEQGQLPQESAPEQLTGARGKEET